LIGAAAIATGVLLAWGCAAPPAAPARLGGPSVETTAEWDDVDAAVSFAAAESEMAVLTRRETADGIEFQLVTVIDEPVWLRITRDGDAPRDDRASRPVSLTARIGRFGDEARERRFVDSIVRRLDRLVDVD